MRRLLACVRIEFLREFTSPMSAVFFLILPLVFTAAVSAGLRGMGGSDSQEPPREVEISLPIWSEDSGPLTQALVDTLETAHVTVERVEALSKEQFGLIVPGAMSAELLAGSPVTLTLQVPGAVSSVDVVREALRPATERLNTAVQVVRGGLQQAREMQVLAPEDEQAFVDGLLDDIMKAAQHPPVVPQVNWGEGGEVEEPTSLTMATNTEQASAGQLVTWVQITLLGAAEVLVGERLLGTLRRLFVMPTARVSILSGKLVARLLLGLTQMAILLVGGALLFGVEWGSDPLAVAVVSLAFALATVGLGILLATIVRTRGQAQSAVVGVSMAMAALGGAWYPIEITPPVYRQVVQVLPSTWAMRAYTDLLARGADVMGVLPEVGVLLLFAAVFTAVGLIRFQRYR